MSKVKTYFVPGIPLILLVGLTSFFSNPATSKDTTSVFVENTTATPVPIQDVNARSSEPVQFGCSVTLPPGTLYSTDVPDTCLSPVVPLGKRLVIEFVSVIAQMPLGQEPGCIIQTASAQFGAPPGFTIQANHRIAFPVTAVTIGTIDEYVASQMVRMYAEQGDDVTVTMTRTSPNDSAFFQINWAGYLVDTE